MRARGYPGIPQHRPSEIWNHLFSTSHVTLGVPSQQELLQLFHVTRPLLASHGVVGSTLLQAEEDDATICNYSENTIHGVFYRHVNALQLHAAHRLNKIIEFHPHYTLQYYNFSAYCLFLHWTGIVNSLKFKGQEGPEILIICYSRCSCLKYYDVLEVLYGEKLKSFI